MIVPLQPDHFNSIAEIQGKTLAGDFQTLLGKKFLMTVYRRYYQSDYGNGFVYMIGDKPAGFALIAYDIPKLMREVLIKDGMHLIGHALLSVLRKPVMVPDLIKQYLMNMNLSHVAAAAELVTIAVDSEHQHQGIGTSLLAKVINDFQAANIRSFKLSTDGDNEPVNAFYKRNGFTVAGSRRRFNKLQNIYLFQGGNRA